MQHFTILINCGHTTCIDDRGVCVHQYTGDGERTALVIQQGGGKNFSQVLSGELEPKHGMILVQQTVGPTSRSQTLSIQKCVCRDSLFTAFIVGLQLEPDVGHTTRQNILVLHQHSSFVG